MNLNLLQSFFVLAGKKSLPLTAKKLGISSEELVSRIEEMNKCVGLPLVNIKGRQIELTAYGEEFLPFAQQGYAKIEEGLGLVHAMADKTDATINLGISPLLNPKYLSHLLFGFMSKFPHIRINIVQHAASALIKLLNEGKVDWLLCCDAILLSGDTKIQCVPIIKSPYVVLISKENPLSQRESLVYEDLCETRQIFTNYITRDNYINKAKLHGFEPPNMVYAGDTASIYDLVANNVGVFFTSGLEHNIDESRIAVVPFVLGGRDYEIMMLSWIDGKPMTAPHILFKNYIISHKEL